MTPIDTLPVVDFAFSRAFASAFGVQPLVDHWVRTEAMAKIPPRSCWQFNHSIPLSLPPPISFLWPELPSFGTLTEILGAPRPRMNLPWVA